MTYSETLGWIVSAGSLVSFLLAIWFSYQQRHQARRGAMVAGGILLATQGANIILLDPTGTPIVGVICLAVGAAVIGWSSMALLRNRR